jgi:hypothetical protein
LGSEPIRQRVSFPNNDAVDDHTEVLVVAVSWAMCDEEFDGIAESCTQPE